MELTDQSQPVASLPDRQDEVATAPAPAPPLFVQLLLWAGVLAAGALHAWGYRHAMGGDGISYMDVASQYVAGNYGDAVNGYWSPLYSWLLAIALYLIQPSAYWDAAVAHLVNFVIYCFAFVAFDYAWRGLRQLTLRPAESGEDRLIPLPGWAWYALGYALFVWISLEMVTVRLVTPDLAVTGLLYLMIGLLARIRPGADGYRRFAVLGLVVGLAYLTKLFVLSIGLLCLVLAALRTRSIRRAWPRLAVACAVTCVIAAPWVISLSKSKARFTLGESGRINYTYMVNDAYPWYHWQGLPPETGTPKHPVRQIHEYPAVFEYAEPVPGSYPVWYDNSYWCEGMTPTFDLAQHLAALKVNLISYLKRLTNELAGLSFCMLALILFRDRWRSLIRELAAMWYVFLPGLAGLGMYAIIYYEPRLIAGFVALCWMALLTTWKTPSNPTARETGRVLALAATLSLVLPVAIASIPVIERTLNDIRYRKDTAPHRQYDIAQSLHEQGLQPGEKVAHVGQALKSWSYWARLAEVQIVAEVRPADAYWMADDATRQHVRQLLADAGARAVVTRRLHLNDRPFGLPVPMPRGWHQLTKTDHYVYWLKPGESQPDASQPSPPGPVAQPASH
jgi:hypothetical protein